VACLFVGLLLVTRITRRLGLTKPPAPKTGDEPRPIGGRRAAR
jgi:hypothetical protein